MSQALFLASTPLHSLWSLAVAVGAFPDSRCALALIDQRPGDLDCIADVLAQLGSPPFVDVVRFEQIGKRPLQKIQRARPLLRQVQAYVRKFDPQYIAVGNDRRAEFYAALRAAPLATAAYMDDGAASYVNLDPKKDQPLTHIGDMVSNGFRSLVYGMKVEHPRQIGGSSAATEAWVMLPEMVHGSLEHKRLRQIEPAWFKNPIVQKVCADAIAKSGLDASAVARLTATKLLIVVPHGSVMRQQPEIGARLEQLARDYVARGLQVACKFHPRSRAVGLKFPEACMEIPNRLPVEILAPMLSKTLVVGSLTTALIFLQRMGQDIEIKALLIDTPPDHPVLKIYRRLGIDILQ